MSLTVRILIVEFSALFLAVWAYIYNTGGEQARAVLTLAPLRTRAFWLSLVFGPGGRHRRPWLSRTQTAVQAASVPEETPVRIDGVLDVLTRREMAEDETGAEHWGTLLQDMNTAERVIFHQETYLLHQDLRAITDPLTEKFDREFGDLMRQWEYRTERVSLGSSESLTGEWPLLYAAPAKASV